MHYISFAFAFYIAPRAHRSSADAVEFGIVIVMAIANTAIHGCSSANRVKELSMI